MLPSEEVREPAGVDGLDERSPEIMFSEFIAFLSSGRVVRLLESHGAGRIQ